MYKNVLGFWGEFCFLRSKLKYFYLKIMKFPGYYDQFHLFFRKRYLLDTCMIISKPQNDAC